MQLGNLRNLNLHQLETQPWCCKPLPEELQVKAGGRERVAALPMVVDMVNGALMRRQGAVPDIDDEDTLSRRNPRCGGRLSPTAEPMVRRLRAGGSSQVRTRLGGRPDWPFDRRSDEFLESIKKGSKRRGKIKRILHNFDVFAEETHS
jgi:hypothetical protein